MIYIGCDLGFFFKLKSSFNNVFNYLFIIYFMYSVLSSMCIVVFNSKVLY